METMKINIPMFTYFDIYVATNNIDYLFVEISMFQKELDTISKTKIVSTHPPLEEILIKAKNTEIIASPYKRTNPIDDESINANLKDIKSLQQQNNFTNHILGTISSQMDRLERTLPLPQTKKGEFYVRFGFMIPLYSNHLN